MNKKEIIGGIAALIFFLSTIWNVVSLGFWIHALWGFHKALEIPHNLDAIIIAQGKIGTPMFCFLLGFVVLLISSQVLKVVVSK